MSYNFSHTLLRRARRETGCYLDVRLKTLPGCTRYLVNLKDKQEGIFPILVIPGLNWSSCARDRED